MDMQAFIPPTMNFTKAGLVAGTTTTISTGGTVQYTIKGKSYSKTAITNGATPTTDYATGNAFTAIGVNKGGVFTIGLDHSGNMKVIQGTIVDLDVSGNFIVAPQFGGLGPAGSGSTDNDFCPLGYLLVQVGSTGSAWTFGSSNTSGATGVTYTFVDCSILPDRPQTS